MAADRDVREPAPLRELSRQGVTGSHERWSVGEIRDVVEAVVAGDTRALLGFDRFYGVTADDVVAAVASVWGWNHGAIVASIDPARTLAAFSSLVERVGVVAESGGRIAFATGRPSSLLPLYLALARFARSRGAEVAEERDTSPFIADGRRGRRLRWLDGVAVVTDGSGVLASQAIEAGPEWVFQVGYPDLWVADHGFVAAAVRSGGRIAAFVDFDAIAVTVAAERAPHLHPIVVPLDDQRSPQAYQVLTDLVSHRFGH